MRLASASPLALLTLAAVLALGGCAPFGQMEDYADRAPADDRKPAPTEAADGKIDDGVGYGAEGVTVYRYDDEEAGYADDATGYDDGYYDDQDYADDAYAAHYADYYRYSPYRYGAYVPGYYSYHTAYRPYRGFYRFGYAAQPWRYYGSPFGPQLVLRYDPFYGGYAYVPIHGYYGGHYAGYYDPYFAYGGYGLSYYPFYGFDGYYYGGGHRGYYAGYRDGYFAQRYRRARRYAFAEGRTGRGGRQALRDIGRVGVAAPLTSLGRADRAVARRQPRTTRTNPAPIRDIRRDDAGGQDPTVRRLPRRERPVTQGTTRRADGTRAAPRTDRRARPAERQTRPAARRTRPEANRRPQRRAEPRRERPRSRPAPQRSQPRSRPAPRQSPPRSRPAPRRAEPPSRDNGSSRSSGGRSGRRGGNN